MCRSAADTESRSAPRIRGRAFSKAPQGALRLALLVRNGTKTDRDRLLTGIFHANPFRIAGLVVVAGARLERLPF